MQVPKHIALIPDGNRRWAQNKSMPSFEGHRYAAQKVLPVLLDHCISLGIEYLTFWTVSTENIKKRTPQEVNHLFQLMRWYVQFKLEEFHKKGVRITTIGDLSVLPEDIQKGIAQSVKKTANNTNITLILALNYGGRDEIVRAVKKMMKTGVSPDDVTADLIKSHLDTSSFPDPDLIIRSGGEQRTSGFLPWQSDYAEYVFIDKLFPDITTADLDDAISQFTERKRRFGK